MGGGDKKNVDNLIEILKGHAEYGLTLTELITISGLSHSALIHVFEALEDSGNLYVKSDGLSRIYKFKD